LVSSELRREVSTPHVTKQEGDIQRVKQVSRQQAQTFCNHFGQEFEVLPDIHEQTKCPIHAPTKIWTKFTIPET
jgi:hypothetical protein